MRILNKSVIDSWKTTPPSITATQEFVVPKSIPIIALVIRIHNE